MSLVLFEAQLVYETLPHVAEAVPVLVVLAVCMSLSLFL